MFHNPQETSVLEITRDSAEFPTLSRTLSCWYTGEAMAMALENGTTEIKPPASVRGSPDVMSTPSSECLTPSTGQSSGFLLTWPQEHCSVRRSRLESVGVQTPSLHVGSLNLRVGKQSHVFVCLYFVSFCLSFHNIQEIMCLDASAMRVDSATGDSIVLKLCKCKITLYLPFPHLLENRLSGSVVIQIPWGIFTFLVI